MLASVEITKNQEHRGEPHFEGINFSIPSMVELRLIGLNDSEILKKIAFTTQHHLDLAWEYTRKNADEMIAILSRNPNIADQLESIRTLQPSGEVRAR